MRLNVIDRDGLAHVIDAPASGTLMEVLRDLDYGVAALCGGMCSCATCHIYIDRRWVDCLPARQSDEHELIGGLQHCDKTSRLACQIELQAALDGLCVTLAPHE